MGSPYLQLGIPQFSSILSGLIAGAHGMPDDIMTLKEVAEYLKLAEKTAYRLAADGTVPGFKVGGSWRFRKTAIEDWIDQKTTKKRI